MSTRFNPDTGLHLARLGLPGKRPELRLSVDAGAAQEIIPLL